MANIVILSPTRSDAATLTADSEISSLPAVNLQNLQPKKKYRTTSLTPYLLLDFGPAGINANSLAYIGHNGGAAATIRARGKATPDVTVAPTVDTAAVSMWPPSGKPADAWWPHHFTWLSWVNGAVLRYWRIDIDDTGNPDGFHQAGRLMVGRYWQPSTNFDISGTPLAFDQVDVQTRTDFGETFTERRTRSAPRRFSLQISAADKREVADGIADIQRLRGGWGDVACVLDPAATADFHRHAMQGVFTAPQEHQMAQLFTPNGETWSVSFPLREVI